MTRHLTSPHVITKAWHHESADKLFCEVVIRHLTSSHVITKARHHESADKLFCEVSHRWSVARRAVVERWCRVAAAVERPRGTAAARAPTNQALVFLRGIIIGGRATDCRGNGVA